MNVADLVAECQHAIDTNTGVVLVLPWPVNGKSKARLVKGRGRCPVGEILCQNAEGSTVARFDPIDVLAFLDANGLAKIEVRSRDA